MKAGPHILLRWSASTSLFLALFFFEGAIVLSGDAHEPTGATPSSAPGRVHITQLGDEDRAVRGYLPEGALRAEPESEILHTQSDSVIEQISLSQPQSFIPSEPPRLEIQPRSRAAQTARRDIDRSYRRRGLRTSQVSRSRPTPVFRRRIPSSDAGLRASSDAGNHIGKSPFAPPVWVQQRNPNVSEPRISGSRVGRIASSGSYWVPARIDLDTMVSKFDSRVLGEVNIVSGPYTTRLGPDFRFIDLELLPSPRADQWTTGGSSAFEFKSNGEQWFGRQTFYGADENWGLRVGYGHRIGNDYTIGGRSDVEIPASYNSRELDVAFGFDVDDDQHVEFHFLHLDQTNVELPGQTFDLDYLKTNGYEVQYLLENQSAFDTFAVSTWYNETDFEGSAQRSGKRRIIPFLDQIRYSGRTDVESLSTGFRGEFGWNLDEHGDVIAGVDLRLLRQDLDEFSSGRVGINVFDNRNSPIPRSFSANPGLYTEYEVDASDKVKITAGARVDLVTTDVIAEANQLNGLGLSDPPRTFAEIVGTDDFDRDFRLWSAFLAAEYQVDDAWSIAIGAGTSRRPPSLTELYAAESFMFLLQNGVNAVTGDPDLDPERMWQVDASLQCDADRFRGSIRGYHAWIYDYITFENAAVRAPFGFIEQINLRYVNTELATLAGADAQGEYDINSFLTAFGTLAYVEGRDQSRNGDFATAPSFAGTPAAKAFGLPRGTFSGVGGGDEEPLPMIPPLRGSLGLRIHEPVEEPSWGVELSAQLVREQNRIATSLLELPTDGYTTWDLRAFLEPTRQLSIFAGIENFTDQSYRTHFDFRNQAGNEVRQPGRNVFVGAELHY